MMVERLRAKVDLDQSKAEMALCSTACDLDQFARGDVGIGEGTWLDEFHAGGITILYCAAIAFGCSKSASRAGRPHNGPAPKLLRPQLLIPGIQMSVRYGRSESSREKERAHHDHDLFWSFRASYI